MTMRVRMREMRRMSLTLAIAKSVWYLILTPMILPMPMPRAPPEPARREEKVNKICHQESTPLS